MSDRGERQFLWFLALVVGAGFCVFPFMGQGSIVRLLVFLPLGVFLMVASAIRLRRLRRRRSRHERVE